MSIITYEIGEIELDVYFYFFPGEERITGKDPSLCSEGAYPEVDIQEIQHVGYDVMNILADNLIEAIEEYIIDSYKGK